jgi:hypothetical protein
VGRSCRGAVTIRKDLEEKMQQQVLESLVSIEQSRYDASEQRLKDVVANLRLYSEHTGIAVCEDVRRKFSDVVQAAFPDWRKQMVWRALEL